MQGINDIALATLSGFSGALFSAALSFYVREKLKERERKKIEQKKSYVQYVKITEIIIGFQVLLNTLDKYGEALAPFFAKSEKYNDNHFWCAAFYAVSTEQLKTAEGTKEVRGYLRALSMSSTEWLEFALDLDILYELPDTSTPEYALFSTAARALKERAEVWKKLADADEISLDLELIYKSWIALTDFYEQSKRLQKILLTSANLRPTNAIKIVEKLRPFTVKSAFLTMSNRTPLQDALIDVRKLMEQQKQSTTQSCGD